MWKPTKLKSQAGFSRCGLVALGEIDFFVHLTATFGFRYHRRYHSLSSY